MSSNEKIWDPLRRRMVASTPEERVRQWFIHVLHSEAGVPLHLMNSEVEIKYGVAGKLFRADILVFGHDGSPLGIVECKRSDVQLTTEVLDQALRYHMVLDVRFLIIVNGMECRVFCRKDGSWHAMDHLPSFQEMILL